ncbi:MAG: hypothetical protein IKA74_06385 [Clostridia bacterium]|nr:hypothetical protein [Clostridia bacterium]
MEYCKKYCFKVTEAKRLPRSLSFLKILSAPLSVRLREEYLPCIMRLRESICRKQSREENLTNQK